jgi:hypothetical protein
MLRHVYQSTRRNSPENMDILFFFIANVTQFQGPAPSATIY